MRKIREVLRLRLEAGLSEHQEGAHYLLAFLPRFLVLVGLCPSSCAKR